MLYKDLCEKICNVTCTLEELKAFSNIKNKKDFPIDVSFNLNSVLKCLDLYEKGVVSSNFVANWATAYDSIITLELDVRFDDKKEKFVSLKDLLIWKTTDWLDSLGFFDDIEPYNSSYFKRAFATLDYIYKVQEKWTVYFSFGTGLWYGDEVFILLVNDSENLYEYFSVDFCFDFFDFKNRIIENAHPLENFENMKSKLIKNGYKRLYMCSN